MTFGKYGRVTNAKELREISKRAEINMDGNNIAEVEIKKIIISNITDTCIPFGKITRNHVHDPK